MKKIILNLFFVFTLFLLSLSFSHACQPCPRELNFSETVKEADLIVIGEKTGEGPPTASNNFVGGPEWTEIKVIEVLKGDILQNPIRVKSWYGMCAYGIVLKDSNLHVIFLKKGKNQYYPINSGCAVKDFLIKNETVYYKDNNSSSGTQEITVDKLVEMIGSEAKRKKVEQTEGNTFKNYLNYIILGAVAGLMFIVFIILLLLIIFLYRKNKGLIKGSKK